MENTIERAKELMEKGWKAREDLDFTLAEKLLTEAKSIFEELSDWYNVTECLNHLAYNDKLKSGTILDHGILLTKEAQAVVAEKNSKDTSVLRAEISLLSAHRQYEKALVVARQLLEESEKPANKADILRHIAEFELRTGKLEKAQKSIENAEELLDEGWEDEKEPHRSIWKVSLLLTKGLISYNTGDIDSARKQGQEALDLALEKDLKTRLTQAKDFLEMLEE